MKVQKSDPSSINAGHQNKNVFEQPSGIPQSPSDSAQENPKSNFNLNEEANIEKEISPLTENHIKQSKVRGIYKEKNIQNEISPLTEYDFIPIVGECIQSRKIKKKYRL
ncbi:hypothetical protein CEXT_46261 [Caerostris extrusa]|uniref:Uncharacterized protein n=1 Tax=Caerostris extrusa TaxID=172846 RepID=A0AAV4RGG8_CAEEX|nr:hypothetical protein CEXT_46261 [Caerostris extrusa]